MKKVILTLITMGLFSSISAEGLGSELIEAGSDIAQAKIKADKEVAIETQATITVENSTLIAEAQVGEDAVIVGTAGSINAIGEQVNIENSTLIAEADVAEDAVVVGTVGSINIGAH